MYMGSSFFIVIFNKIVLTVFAFTSVPFIMIMQSLFTVAVFLLKCTPIQCASEDRSKKDLALVCLLNIGNIFFGLSSAAALNIAMFTALRRVSIFMTMMAQYYVFGEPIDKWVYWSVLIMIIGSMIAAANDLTFSLRGYTFVMVNNVLTTAAQIQTKKTLESSWSKPSILFWSAICSACVSLVSVIHWDPNSFNAWDNWAFQFAFFCSIVLGFAINYSYTWTIEQNDALTLAVAGSTKSAIMGLMVVMGLFDRTYIFSWWNCIGLQISTFGSFMYVWFKNKHKPNETVQKENTHTQEDNKSTKTSSRPVV